MSELFDKATALCRTMQRNGYEAYVINARLTLSVAREDETPVFDIATDMTLDELVRVFPEVKHSNEHLVLGHLLQDGVDYRFYQADIVDGSHPETTVARVTDRLLKQVADDESLPPNLACPYLPRELDQGDPYAAFAPLDGGNVKLLGLPDDTLRHDYLLAIRALRMSANFDMFVERNTWTAIIRAGRRVLDYVSITEIMDEWRKVQPENMHIFVQRLFDTMILHGLVPELAALSRIREPRNEKEAEKVTILEQSLAMMQAYTEELPYDWYGTLACLFHAVGKLYTAEYVEDRWTFYHHTHVGAKVTRKIMRHLRFPSEDIDLVTHLVRHNHRFHMMLTDRGVKRFMALDDYPRLIEMARAEIKSREGSYAAFNSNQKNMERIGSVAGLEEPLLNGREIMDETGMTPGPVIGLIREALLQAQLAGDVSTVQDAVEFVQRYKDREILKQRTGGK